jgi:glycosyltransferase involved in cell wall biosynthesis
MIDPRPTRILFVAAQLAVGSAETTLRLLARHLDRSRHRLDVVACFRGPGTPDQTHRQLAELGVAVDTTPYDLSYEDTVAYLARRIPGYDLVVSCQNVADIYPALERLAHRPPLIELGGRTIEALAGPKHFTARHVGPTDAIRDAAARRMADRPRHAVEIPPMVDLGEFRPDRRWPTRAALGVAPGEALVGWVGRLDRRKRVEDFLRAAALVRANAPRTRFVVIGGTDASTPDYAAELHALAADLRLADFLHFLGDRPDVPDLLAAMDVIVSLSQDGLPHVIAEAGATSLAAVVASAAHPIEDEASGLCVPPEDPPAAAAAILRLLRDPVLRARLGRRLNTEVAARCSTEALIPAWQALFDSVLAEVPPAPPPQVFRSFVQGGWECSSHRRRDGRRLDLLASTGHDEHAEADYRQLGKLGVATLRDGLRWHRIETQPGVHDFASWTPMLRAARRTGAQVIWDLMHYGWPDHLDVWSEDFVDRFAQFAAAAARRHAEETDAVPFWCPVNEISFLSWGGGDAAYLNPFAQGRGFELKVQLARAAIAAMRALRAVDPRARFVQCEPLIAVHHDDATGRPRWEAEGWHDAQYQALDLLAGRIWPQIGGEPGFIDIVGVNYYSFNQWLHGGPQVGPDHPAHRPLSDLLVETYARYGRPILLSETGIEGDARAAWLRMVADEVAHARARGVPVEGICLYPIANHFGWDNDRLCPNGLLGHEPHPGGRLVHAPLAKEVRATLSRFGTQTADAGFAPMQLAAGGELK